MRILIVEDNSYARLTLKVAIEKMGHTIVGEACDFGEAIEKVNNIEYDLMLLDILIPGGNGLDVIRHITQTNKKVIAITAVYQDEIDKELMRLGVKGIVRKPFSYDDLKDAIKKCCDE